MNLRHIYLIRNALKLTYGNLVLKNFSGGYTPGPPPSGEPRLTRWGRDASDAREGGEGGVGPPNFETVVAPLVDYCAS